MRSLFFTLLLLFILSSQAICMEVAVIVGFPHPAKKLELIKRVASEEGVELKAFYIRRVDELKNLKLPDADLYIIDIHGDDTRVVIKELLRDRRYFILSRPPEGVEHELTKTMFDYYESGGTENFRNLFRLLLGKEAAPPKRLPLNGFYIKGEGVYEFLPEHHRSKRPVVVTFHRAELVSEDTAVVDRVIDEFEKRGRKAVGFFYSEYESLKKQKEKLLEGKKPFASMIINLRLMFMNYEDERKGLEELGLITMGGHVLRGKLEDWLRSEQGLPIPSLPFYYTIQEYMGIVDLTLIGYEEGSRRAIDYMVENFVSRANRWIKLMETENREKKIAFVFYSYPPQEGNISASNLNVPRSIELILKEAKRRGYDVADLREEELRERFNSALRYYFKKEKETILTDCLTLQSYLDWFNLLPAKVREEMNRHWGLPERDPNLRDGCFHIPVVKAGNFAFLPLAPRGRSYSESREIYHSTKTPPSHYYLAFYLYIQKNFDALIHFGTHGTQEWTPGKERALSLWDYPYLTLGDIPVIYPYVVDNIGEAINAKRRGRAVIVSHQTPAFAPTGTYGDLEDLHQLLHRETQIEGRQKDVLRRTIAEKALKSRIAYDLGFRSKEEILQKYEDFSKALHDHIHDIASQNMPLGLHTFGKTKELEHLGLTILQILGKEWVDRWEGGNYTEFLSQPIDRIKDSRSFKRIVDCLQESQPECERVREIGDRLDASSELSSLFLALEGGYVSTSYGGDPIRNPDSLPTGRNLYSFDPSRVPTLSAWQTAVELTDEMLRDHLTKHKAYPKKIAFSLWSTETMRHLGVTEAQILYLLGVKPRWDQGGVVTGIEVIPRQQLKRPRIDVVVSATGLYRDHFPNLIALINRAVEVVSAQREEDNSVAESTERIKRFLLEKGFDEKEAIRLSTIRGFTNESGAYGTGLDEAVFKERERSTLAKLFTSRMGYFLREDGSTLKIEGLFEENLKDAEAVLLSRSSNLYGMLSSDDPFQYLGGLSMAVEVLSNRRPAVLIANLRSSARIQSAEQFLLNEMRSRYLNPEWIKGMMKEGASGVTVLLDTVNNLYGWQIVAPQVVKNYLWRELKEVYLDDKYKLGVKQWLTKNPQAMKSLKERLLEGMSLAGYGLRVGSSSPSVFTQNPYQTVRGSVLERLETQNRESSKTLMAQDSSSVGVYLLLIFLYLYGFCRGIIRKTFA